MSNTAIKIKKSGETGNTPSDLVHGEIAINYADGKLYYKNDIDGLSYINNQDSFATINVNSELILAGSPTDTLSFVSGSNIILEANTITKTITINSTASGGGGGGFPLIDLGYVFEPITSYDMLDMGTLI
jgi:hypothetical protein